MAKDHPLWSFMALNPKIKADFPPPLPPPQLFGRKVWFSCKRSETSCAQLDPIDPCWSILHIFLSISISTKKNNICQTRQEQVNTILYTMIHLATPGIGRCDQSVTAASRVTKHNWNQLNRSSRWSLKSMRSSFLKPSKPLKAVLCASLCRPSFLFLFRLCPCLCPCPSHFLSDLAQ